MALAIVHSRACAGLDAPEVTIEVHLANGLPSLNIVGLPEKEVKESKDRVRSAIQNSAFDFPVRRITVNLAPADLPKEGGRYDLPIALGILAASNQIPLNSLEQYEFAGELALSGELRSVNGVLPHAMAACKAKRKLLIPQTNVTEALLAREAEIFGAIDLLQVCGHLQGMRKLTQEKSDETIQVKPAYPDLVDVKGQAGARRALEIAASGGHSLLLIGPPGTGKTMLAMRLPGILPELSEQTALEVASVYSISLQGFDVKHWRERPFRAPHHSASSAALVGGGRPPKPGEITLAHRGVLFLDELPEFNRQVLESLREPLEAGVITISRASHQVNFPATFQLVAAMNPCPCGYHGDPSGRCRCTQEQVQRYQLRLSGPLLDRIDLHVAVPPLPMSVLLKLEKEKQENSGDVQQRVVHAQYKQQQRAGKLNASQTHADMQQHCLLEDNDIAFLEGAIEKFGLSARTYHRTLKIARTIADMGNSEKIQRSHIAEALSYRSQNKVL